jgi:DNA-binding IclR family transcriptional regulator
MAKNDSSINKSLKKALNLLDYFDEEHEVWGLTELSKVSGVSKATLYRLFNTFEKQGFLERIDTQGKTNQYRLGLKFLQYGTLVSDRLEIKNIAYPFMKQLRDEINEDVQLILRDNDHAIYVEKIKCDHPVRLYTKIGRSATFNAGACPRAILSFLPDEEIEDIMDHSDFIEYSKNTIMDRDKLWETIKEARARGYTISYGEMEEQTVAIGAPIFDYTQQVVASISIAGPEQRFTEEKMDYLIEKTLETAHKISKALGYQG